MKKEGVRRLFAAALAAALGLAAAPVRAQDLYPGNGAAAGGSGAALFLPGPSVQLSTPVWPSGPVSTGTFTFNWQGPSTSTIGALDPGSYYFLQASAGDETFAPGNIAVAISTPAVVHSTGVAFTDGIYVSTFALADNTTFYWRVALVSGSEQGPWSSTLSFRTDFSSPAAAGFQSKKADGSWLGEQDWNSLAGAATAQVTVQDIYSGLMVSTAAGPGGFGVMYSTNAGYSWLTEGMSVSYNGAQEQIYALAVYNGKLYAGQGNSAGDGDVLVYDGSSWSVSYNGAQEAIYSLAVYNGKLYAGQGNSAGDGDVLVYDGSSWTVSYDSAQSAIASLAVYNGKLYAGQGYTAGEGDVLVYDGSSWSVSYNGAQEAINSLAVYNGRLYAGQGSGAGDGDVLVYDGSNWSVNYDGAQEAINSLAVYNGRLYA
ncbi:MAG TPA: hypothetical protein PKI19_11720, partial [Elusimicrobiales bacterium]|nr:hypothetical protein [Elusimicrobiales bacterium]